MKDNLQDSWAMQQLAKLVDAARKAGLTFDGLDEAAGIIDQYRGKAPHESVANIPCPLVLYFSTDADRDEMVTALGIVKPHMKTIKL